MKAQGVGFWSLRVGLSLRSVQGYGVGVGCRCFGRRFKVEGVGFRV